MIFLDVQLYFSSSIALAMHQSRIDLARRATIIDVYYFSFLEATQKKLGAEIHAMPISHIFEGNQPPHLLNHDGEFAGYITGAICPFIDTVINVPATLHNIIKNYRVRS